VRLYLNYIDFCWVLRFQFESTVGRDLKYFKPLWENVLPTQALDRKQGVLMEVDIFLAIRRSPKSGDVCRGMNSIYWSGW
jgi:hypothetical protein